MLIVDAGIELRAYERIILHNFFGLKFLGPIKNQVYAVRSSDKRRSEINESKPKTAQLTRQHDALVVLWTMDGRVLKCQSVKRGKAAAVSRNDDLQREFALIAHSQFLRSNAFSDV